jgi:hypothetical protein
VEVSLSKTLSNTAIQIESPSDYPWARSQSSKLKIHQIIGQLQQSSLSEEPVPLGVISNIQKLTDRPIIEVWGNLLDYIMRCLEMEDKFII